MPLPLFYRPQASQVFPCHRKGSVSAAAAFIMNKVATALGASGVARTDKTLAGAARTTIATRRRAVYCEPQDPCAEIVSL